MIFSFASAAFVLLCYIAAAKDACNVLFLNFKYLALKIYVVYSHVLHKIMNTHPPTTVNIRRY